MATGSVVFGSCDWEIDVSIEVENSDVWLCCGLKDLGFILAEKVAQNLCWRMQMVPGIGGHF